MWLSTSGISHRRLMENQQQVTVVDHGPLATGPIAHTSMKVSRDFPDCGQQFRTRH
jgi:hypothetical protein